MTTSPFAPVPAGDDAFYRHYRPLVAAFVGRRVETHAVDDLVAEVFLVTWRRRGDVPDDALPWLYRTARNIIGNRYRSDTRRIALFDKMRAIPQESPADPGDVAGRDRVLAALGELSDDDRELLLLVAWEGLTTPESAAVLDISPGTAAVRLAPFSSTAQAPHAQRRLHDKGHSLIEGFDLLPALNPEPEPRGNPGPMPAEEAPRRWPELAAGLAAAAALIVFGAVFVRRDAQPEFELEVAAEPTPTGATAGASGVQPNDFDDRVDELGSQERQLRDRLAADQLLAPYRKGIGLSIRCYGELGVDVLGPWPAATGLGYRTLVLDSPEGAVDRLTAGDRCGHYASAAHNDFAARVTGVPAAQRAVIGAQIRFVGCLKSTSIDGEVTAERIDSMLALPSADVEQVDISLADHVQDDPADAEGCFGIDADGDDWLSPLLNAPAESIAVVLIPAIDVGEDVVDGVELAALDAGVFRYLSSAWPGQPGNAVLFGQRVMAGAPFGRLDELAGGDEIQIVSQRGGATYVVESSSVAARDDVSFLGDKGDNRLTFVSHNSEFSARENGEKLVIVASLVGLPDPPRPSTEWGPAPQSFSEEHAPGAPIITEAYLRTNGNNPFFGFVGTHDWDESAEAFLATQFRDPNAVSTTLHEEADRAVSLRWADADTGAEGWLVLILADGRYAVADMTTDGFQVDLHESSEGPRGYVVSERPATAVFYAREAAGDEPIGTVWIGETQIGERVPVQLPSTDLHISEVRVEITNSNGDQVGAAISTLEQGFGLVESRLVTHIDDTAALIEVLESRPLLVFDRVTLDEWQSAEDLYGAYAGEDIQVPELGDRPEHQVTTVMFEEFGRELDYRQHRELVGELSNATVTFLPQRQGLDPDAVDASRPPPRSLTTITASELPAAARCATVGVAGAPSTTIVNDQPAHFPTARDAVEESDWLGNFDAGGQVRRVEFVDTDGGSLGFAATLPERPFTFLVIAEVEQSDQGWRVTQWQRVGC